MAPILPFIQAAAGIAGIVSTVRGITSSRRSDTPSKPEPLPQTLTEQDAREAADEEAKRRRRLIQNTDVTRGAALVPELNVQQKSLLGF